MSVVTKLKGILLTSTLTCLICIVFTYQIGAQAQLDFSQERGFSDTPFNLTITSLDPSATIRYTLDGEEPSTTSGVIYNGSIPIGTTTVLRAIGYIIGVDTSKVYTHTYLFINDIINQPENISGWPNNIYDIGSGSATAVHDYEMDPAIVNSSLYNTDLIQGLKDIPSMSIVMPKDDFWDVNDGNAEKKTSIELLYANDPSKNEQEDGGIEPHSHNRLKRSFRLSFKNIYGAGDWDSDIFRNAVVGSETAQNEFDRIVLRAGNNRAWSRNWNTDRTAFTRDEWFRQSQIASSGIGSHGTFVHLFINGLYWGLYNPIERPDESFTSTYLGGDKEDWFAVSHGGDQGGVDDRYDYLKTNLLFQDLTNSTNYEELKLYLDIDKFSDYVLLSWMTGVQDWPGNNWWGGNSNNPTGPFMFFGWDNEWSWDVTKNANNGAWVHPDFESSDTGGQNSALVFNKAKVNDDFMMSFADRVYKLCYNDGVMTDANSRARWSVLNDNIENAVVAESARWGDGIDDGVTRTRDVHWQNEVNRLDGLMNGNVQRLITALLGENYYPTINPPLIVNNGSIIEVQELSVPNNYNIDLINPNGSGQIYYTTNGIDPRMSGGNIDPSAIAYTNGSIVINTSTSLLARVKNGTEWSALHCLSLILPEDLSLLKLTEIMYNPGDFGAVSGSELEFLEIKNTSNSLSLDIGGLQIADGVDFTFPAGTIMGPQSFLIVASNAVELSVKCPGINIFGEYQGQLSNGGEIIAFLNFVGQTVISVEYDDIAPWPSAADGGGYSLVSSTLNPVGSQNGSSFWTVSADNFCGSPGADECNSSQIGQSCNDGDDCTANDVLDGSCNCVGVYSGDSDGDGICNALDQCPLLNDNLIGTACDDLNACTENDVYTTNCICEGSISNQVESIILSPSDDAYIQGTTAFNSNVLRVEEGNRTSYLKFDLSSISGNLSTVDLILSVSNDPGTGVIEVFKGDGSVWSESTLSVTNAPSQNGSLGSLNQTYAANQTYTWNLDVSQIQTEIITLIVVHSNGNDVSFNSKENTLFKPELEVQYVGAGSQVGDACDDGNADTYQDVITIDCLCLGTQYSSFGDYIWMDENSDGIQNNLEAGISGIDVELYDSQNNFIVATTSLSNGLYSFGQLVIGDYYIKVDLSNTSYIFSPYAQGVNTQIDSDIDNSNGVGTTPVFNLNQEIEFDVDVGLSSQVVPVKWLGFSAKHRDGFNQLDWSTASEINSSCFEIERAFNSAIGFVEIGKVNASGHSIEPVNYEMNDYDIDKTGTYYYRLKQVDVDGNFSYSNIVSCTIEKKVLNNFEIYPNPAFDKVSVALEVLVDSDLTLSIWGARGELVWGNGTKEYIEAGEYNRMIDIGALSNGIYIIKISVGHEEFIKKLMVVKD